MCFEESVTSLDLHQLHHWFMELEAMPYTFRLKIEIDSIL